MIVFYVLKRLRLQWRPLLFLLISIALATSFAGLGPLYLRYTSEVSLDYALANMQPIESTLTVMSPVPYREEGDAVVAEQLGPYIDTQTKFARSIYLFGAQQSTCIIGNPDDPLATYVHCLQVFGFDETFAEHYTLVEGSLPSPEIRREETLDGASVILYIDAMITPEIAERANLAVGRSITLQSAYVDGVLYVSYITIKGIMEPNNPEDYFWVSNPMMARGGDVELPNLGTFRYDYGVALDLEAFAEVYEISGATAQYVHFMTMDPDTIDAEKARTLVTNLDATTAQLQRILGEPIQSVSGVLSILRLHQQRIERTEGAIIVLAALLMVLILYNLVSTVSMIFYTQANEWTMLRARGSSTRQLLPTQLVPAMIIGGLAFIFTAVFTKWLLYAMSGANHIINGTPQHTDIINRLETPTVVYTLSAITAVIFALLFLVPIFQAERSGIMARRQLASRPVTKPRWATLFLDFVFIGIGFMLVLRLYYLSEEGTITAFLQDLFGHETDPAAELAATAGAPAQYSDPLSFAAPIFLLTGSALLWLRLFPLLMRLLSLGVDRLRRLGPPLAVWNVERNSGHYRQFALLLVGTLAIGTASVSLLRTQQNGAWNLSRRETGGHAKLVIDPSEVDRSIWRDSTDVVGYAEFIHEIVTENGISPRTRVHVIGVDQETFNDLLPNPLSAINQFEDIPLSGMELPANAETISVDVWSERFSDERLVDPYVSLRAYLYDENGVNYEVNLDYGEPQPVTREPTPSNEWLPFVAELPNEATGTLRLYRLSVESRHVERNQFSHEIYLANWATTDVDGTSTALVVTPEQGWEPAQTRRAFVGNWIETLDPNLEKIDGISSAWVDATDLGLGSVEGPVLHLDYRIAAYLESTATHPSVAINPTQFEPLTAILSVGATSSFRGRGDEAIQATSPALEVGNEREVNFNLGLSGNLTIRFEVLDVVEEFPTLYTPFDRNVIILPIQTTRLLFNQQYSLGAPESRRMVESNEVWLQFPDWQPSEAFVAQVKSTEAITDSIFAWNRYTTILNQPVPNTVAGLFFAGFWVSLVLSLLNFMLYISITAQQRIVSFGVLRSLGWNINHIWRLMFMEQTVLFIPTVVIGTGLGVGLAFLLMPFLDLPGSFGLQLPLAQIAVMAVTLSVSFVILLSAITLWIRQVSIAQMIRLSEE